MDTLDTTTAHLDRAALDHLLDMLAADEVLHPAIVELVAADARRHGLSEVMVEVVRDPLAPVPVRVRATARLLGGLLAAHGPAPAPAPAGAPARFEALEACC